MSGEKRSYSPTQVATYLDCPRKWGFDKLDGIAAPQHPSAALGEATHYQLEHYYVDGLQPDPSSEAGMLALVTLPYWPDITNGTIRAEAKVSFEWEGLRFGGKQDLGWWEQDTYHVGDLKTTSDLKYAKNTEQLTRDPQTLVYGLAAVLRENTDTIWFRWVYTRTRGARKVQPVNLTLCKEEIVKGFEEVVLPVARLLEAHHANGDKGMDLTPNPESCPKYGGCHYGKVGVCKLGAMERLIGQMNAVEKIKALKAAQTGEAQKAAAVPMVASEPTAEESVVQSINPPSVPEGGGLLAKLKAKMQNAVAVAKPAPTECVCGEPVVAGKSQCAECASASEPPAKVVPSVPQPNPANHPLPAAVATPAPTPAPQNVKKPILPPTVVPATVVSPPVVAPSVPEKAAVKDTSTPHPPASNQSQPKSHGQKAFEAYALSVGGQTHDGKKIPRWESLTDAVRAGWEFSTAPARNLPVLCIGCLPDQHSTNVLEIIRPLHDTMVEKLGVLDYRVVEYGKGAGYLLAVVEEYLTADPNVLSGYLYADPRDAMTAVCLPAFVKRAHSVIRGVV